MIDTHSHLYDTAFDADRAECIERDRAAGVEAVFLPAIDSSSDSALLELCRQYPGYCYPMAGLHPTSVNESSDLDRDLKRVAGQLASSGRERYYGVGETGLDLYWSREKEREQVKAFEYQIELSLQYGLPVIVHTRDAWELMHQVLGRYAGRGLRGIMHAFSGTAEDYLRVKNYGDFLFGVGGVVTYKKSGLAEAVIHMSLDDIVLESDAPYLTPVPFRGRRNESGMMIHSARLIAQLKETDTETVIARTTANAKKMFGI